MKTCEACGLPAPSSTLACALCSEPFPNQGPITYRLSTHEGRYRWYLEGEEVATAAWRDGTWDVRDTNSDRVAVTLIGVSNEARTRVAMVDHLSRVVATFIPGEAGADGVGLVRDSYDKVVMAVRDDGPTGTHIIDTDGRVLAMASRLGGARQQGLDLLLTRAGVRRTETIVFGVTLATELLRQGQLSTVT
ncbi:MAG TPA: hypothetical protein VEI97_19000 [bacterium]|nr:hypothetical protein [bacterium]